LGALLKLIRLVGGGAASIVNRLIDTTVIETFIILKFRLRLSSDRMVKVLTMNFSS
jgi:hypothetical protein